MITDQKYQRHDVYISELIFILIASYYSKSLIDNTNRSIAHYTILLLTTQVSMDQLQSYLDITCHQCVNHFPMSTLLCQSYQLIRITFLIDYLWYVILALHMDALRDYSYVFNRQKTFKMFMHAHPKNEFSKSLLIGCMLYCDRMAYKLFS